MHNLVPGFITKQLKNGNKFGQFPAVCLFVDLAGYSTITTALMELGQHGAEVLATIMRALFDPMINTIYQYGGFIATFSGDAFTAVFPHTENHSNLCMNAVASALKLQEIVAENRIQTTTIGEFVISIRVGVSDGETSWGIISDQEKKRASYYFRGSAIEGCVEAQNLAANGEIIIDEGVLNELQGKLETERKEAGIKLVGINGELPPTRPLPEPRTDHEEQNIFFPEGILTERMQGEFRHIVNMFVSLPTVRTEPQLEIFMQSLFRLQDKYGGMLNRLDFGDKGSHLLLFWGAPVTYENDIGRALNFILNLQTETSIPIKAGITYRISHAGFIGNDLQGEFTCYGQGINLAARFMTKAARGEVWVDEAIARRVDRFFDIEFVDEFEFKGFDKPEKTYTLFERRENIEEFFSGPFLGRSEELKFIKEKIAPLWKGEFPEPLVIAGEPGIGKSRLIYEAHRDFSNMDQEILYSRCQTDQVLRGSFNPLRYWAKKYFEINDSYSDSRNKRNFNRKLDDLIAITGNKRLASELDRTRSFLGSLVNLYWEDSLYEQLEPKDRYDNTIIGLNSLIKSESLKQPVVLFIEDVQWLDDDSKTFLEHLVRTKRTEDGQDYQIMILATSRDHCGEGCLGNGITYDQLILEELQEPDILLLARKTMDGQLDEPLERILLDLAQGNPFFAEQILLYLNEKNLIKLVNSTWTLLEDQPELLPEDVRALLVARIDQTNPALKEIIQTAAVVGRTFDLALLELMLDGKRELSDHLAEGEESMMWTEVDESTYVFRNNLLRDAAYKMQTRTQRKGTHQKAVLALEDRYQDEREKVYPELAYHAEMAEMTDKALHYLFNAGKHAKKAYQNQQALDYFTKAIVLQPTPKDKFYLNLLLERESIHALTGNQEEQINDLRLADRAANLIDDLEIKARINSRLASYYIILGDYARSVTHVKLAIDLAQKAENRIIEADARIILAECARNQGQFTSAIEEAKKSVKLAQQEDDLSIISLGLNSLALSQINLGHQDKAIEYNEQILAIVDDIENLSVQAQSLNNASLIYQNLGNYNLAYTTFTKALELVKLTGNRRGESIVTANLGWIAGLLGDYEQSVNQLSRSIEIAKETGDIYSHAFSLINLSLFKTSQRDFTNAEIFVTQALHALEEVGHTPGVAVAWTYLGHAQLGQKKMDDAKNSYQQALALFQNLELKTLMMEPLAGISEITRREEGPHEAMTYVGQILEFLKSGGSLLEIDQPFRVYTICSKVLLEADHPDAVQFVQDAHTLLQEQADNIADDNWRDSFLNNVPYHREMVQLYQQVHAN